VRATVYLSIIVSFLIVYCFNAFILTLRERYAFLFLREKDASDGEEEQIRLLALPPEKTDERTDGYGKEKKRERPPRRP